MNDTVQRQKSTYPDGMKKKQADLLKFNFTIQRFTSHRIAAASWCIVKSHSSISNLISSHSIQSIATHHCKQTNMQHISCSSWLLLFLLLLLPYWGLMIAGKNCVNIPKAFYHVYICCWCYATGRKHTICKYDVLCGVFSIFFWNIKRFYARHGVGNNLLKKKSKKQKNRSV